MSDPNGTPEGVAALRDYLRREREKQAASDNLLDALRTAASAFSDASSEQDYIKEAQERAREYAEARNRNLRPVRVVDPDNEAAVEGQQSALSWLERRKASKIRK